MKSNTLVPRLVPGQTGPTYEVFADLVTFKATGEETGNAYALFEICTPPHTGMPPHRQRYEDEAFFVLEGSYTLLVGDRRQPLRPGDYAFVPCGVVHACTNTGDTPARMLVLLSPGGIHEQFFAEAGVLIAHPGEQPHADRSPDVLRLIEIAAKYGIEILPTGTN